MKKTWIPVAACALAALIVATGCAKKEEQPAGTSTDTTLSMNDVPATGAPTPDTAAVAPAEPTPEPTPAPEPAQTATKPKPKPAPTPAPKPAAAPGVTVPAGTEIKLTMDAKVSTKDKQAGDTFTATVAQDVSIDRRVIIPAGSQVQGHVVEAVRPGKVSGKGKLVLGYDTITIDGKTYNIDTVGAPIESKSGTAGDVGKVAGGAAAGAVVSKILGGSAATGALIGAGAGTAATMATRGPEAEVKAGATLSVSLDKSITVK